MRVLLVAGATSMASAVKRRLDGEGLFTEVIGNGLEGLEAALTGEYDAVVLDIMLPGMNGYDVCKEMRAAALWTPVMMLSAKDGEHDEVDAFDLGADDYLVEPFSFPVLVARLRALIRRGGVPRPAELVAGDLGLDPATHEVRRGSVRIALTPREYGLLHHLMRRKGMVVSKVELLANVWDSHDEGTDAGENVVEVYIGYLRRKVDHPFDRNAVQTVRGAGYRIAADGG